MKNNMKSWISLFVMASLTTACGALKKDNKAADTSTKTLSAKASPTPTYPAITLNSIDTTLGTWTAPNGKQFEVVGKIAKQEAVKLIGDNSDSYTSIGSLSITRESKKYETLYTGNDFLPTAAQGDEDHPEIEVYFGQAGDPNTSMILVLEDDYQSLKNGNTAVNIQYAVALVCTQWNAIATPNPYLSGCLVQNSVITCQSYGNCSSSCPLVAEIAAQFHTPLPDYTQEMTDNIGSSNCIHHEQWPTKSVQLENTSAISEFRIHPTNESKLQASQITFQGQSL